MNTLIKRWQTFILERFSPLKHLLLICSLFGANAFVVLQTVPASKEIPLLSFIVVLLAFFRLRLFDEIKDFETDQKINPQRPLARGLIPLREAKKMAFLLLFVELLLSLVIGFPSLISACIYGLYSLLMYKEFFLRSWLRSKLATYALTHTIVSGLIALFIFSAMTNLYFWEAPTPFFLFTIANWMIFNVFEFGRKTFGKEEEQNCVDSYSKNFGALGATTWVLSMGLIAVGIALYIRGSFFWPLLTPLFLYLFISGLLYSHQNSIRYAKTFRKACSAFILFYNLIISLGFVLC